MAKEKLSPGEIEEANRSYLDIIIGIERTCWSFGLDHRFVGGTLTDLLNPRTTAQIDFEGRRILLSNYAKPQMFRSDGTVKDVDIICLNPDRNAFYEAKNVLKEQKAKARKEKRPFPEISLEPTLYPHWPPRKPLFQFVSGLEEDPSGKLYLTFDHLSQQIDPATLQRWTVVLPQSDNAWFTTLNPYAHALRYLMRVPSGMKKKDREIKKDNGILYDKMAPYVNLGVNFADQAELQGVDMRGLYAPWIEFTMKMRYDQNPFVMGKRVTTQVYWDSVGTALAHGKGMLKPFASLGDKFTG